MNSEAPVFFFLQERDKFASELSQCQLPNRVAGDNLSDAVQLWREGLLTNWEYLMQLNKMAGRSYNDLMQYPVFPFVIADYTSQVLELTDPQVYRYFYLLIIVTVLTLCHIMSDINHIVKFLILFEFTEMDTDNYFLWHTTYITFLDLGGSVYIVAVKYSAVLTTQAETVFIS
jgi:hypothetical protein